jgi:4-amino-4-deoxy-L-arabinose transferase-like glycosyltransferase
MKSRSAPASERAWAGVAPPAGARRDRLALGVFFGYVVLQLVFRVLASDSAELDESEQLMLTQHLDWGYSHQPPLYTWLQTGVFAVGGVNIFSLAVLKSTLIFALLAFMHRAVRELGEADRTAWVATTSLFLIPHFAWEARRDLSHTVLALAMVAATLFFLFRMLRRRRWADYAGFGLSAGLGLLGKFNYLLFLAALILATLPSSRFRTALFNKQSLLALAVLLGVTGMPLGWLLAHRSVVEAGAKKLLVSGAANPAGAWAAGLGSLVSESLSVVAVVAAFYAVFFLRAPRVAAETEIGAETRKLLRRTLLIGLLLCVGAVCFFQVRFKARWLLPLLMLAPMYLALRVGPRLEAGRTRWFLRLAGAVAVIALIALPAAAPLAPLTGKYTRLNAPYAALASALKQRGVAPGVIAAANRLVGGNLRLFFDASTIVTPELPGPPPADGVEWLVVWDATKTPAMPPSLAEFVTALRGVNPARAEPQYVESFLKYSQTRTMKLGFVTLPARF